MGISGCKKGNSNQMKIAVIGTRGIPACYGGFETFAEELATRLVTRGHSVTVYGRSNIITYKEKTYKGVDLVVLPTISHKYLDTIFHTFLSLLHAATGNFSIILLCNAANSPFSFIPRLKGAKVVVNVDGIERKRAKWNALGRLWYRLGEWCSTVFPNTTVADARTIQQYYFTTFSKQTVFIPYGASTEKVCSTEILKHYDLVPGEYILYVSRLEPENNAHLVIGAFEKIKTDLKLVIVGDAPYSSAYISNLKSTHDSRIIFTGYVFGKGYKEFQSHAYCYVHATSVGGTHPALIEAMGFGNCVIANGTPENKEVVRDAAIVFEENSENDLAEKLHLVVNRQIDLDEYKKRAVAVVKKNYSWEAVTDAYESLFHRCLSSNITSGKLQ
jgi:glycosyltransferase involved in cell wall biosynthesis